MMVEILRPFESDGRALERGEVVDASAWRLTRQLENLRYIAPVLAAVAEAPSAPRRRAGKDAD